MSVALIYFVGLLVGTAVTMPLVCSMRFIGYSAEVLRQPEVTPDDLFAKYCEDLERIAAEVIARREKDSASTEARRMQRAVPRRNRLDRSSGL